MTTEQSTPAPMTIAERFQGPATAGRSSSILACWKLDGITPSALCMSPRHQPQRISYQEPAAAGNGPAVERQRRLPAPGRHHA
jgi:hypothetical protein